MFDDEMKGIYFNELAEKGLDFVKDVKLYGYPIDITNPRDVIAALYSLYENKEFLVKSQERLNDFNVQIHKG